MGPAPQEPHRRQPDRPWRRSPRPVAGGLRHRTAPGAPAVRSLIGLLITGCSRVRHRRLGGHPLAAWALVDDYLGLILASSDRGAALHCLDPRGTFEDIPAKLERQPPLTHLPAGDAPPGDHPRGHARDRGRRPLRLALLWNEFLYARLLTTSQNTLPLQVFQAIDRGTKQQMAAVRLSSFSPSCASSPCCSGIFGRHADRSREG